MNAQSAARALRRACVRQPCPSPTRTCRQHIRRCSSTRPSLAPPPLLRSASAATPAKTPVARHLIQQRHESTAKPLTDRPDRLPDPEPREEQPAYEMTFTCKACTTRSSHRISKQGYHHGTILITCPGCKNRHLISDHLKIFSDKSITLEDILQQKGQLLKRGSLGAEGDVEFWDDGTQTERSKPDKSD